MCDNMRNIVCPGCASQYKWPVLISLGIVLLVVIVLALLIVYGKEIIHGYKVRSLSKTLPHISDNFVGREDEMQVLLERAKFELSEIRIINIVGSPGFGKSTLAIQLGHKLIDKGVSVHYVNLAEFPDYNIELVLAEKLLKSSYITAKTVTFDRLLQWARERSGYTLLILDNCDNVLHTQKDRFQNTVLQIVQTSTTIKIVMTSRETAFDIEHYSWYKVHEISPKAAISLLDQKLPKRMAISLIDKEEIANLTGNVPLALHIVGFLLTLEDPLSPALVIKELRKNSMAVLSPNELPVQLRINTSISLSYHYLDDNLKKVAHFLALFDGSFNKGAALNIAEDYQSTDGGMLRLNQYELRNLVKRSLVEYNDRTKRYQYHRLIREFLLSKEDMLQHKINHSSFSLGFRRYFLDHLYKHTINFNLHYVDSLRFLDNERHCIYKLLQDLTNPRAVSRHLLMVIVDLVTHAIDIGFLTCRFTSHELKLLLNETVLYLDKHVIKFQKRANDKFVTDISGRQWTQKDFYQQIYTQLIITYSNILANADNEHSAINFMEARTYKVDVLFEAETELKTSTRKANPATNPVCLFVTTKTMRQAFYESLGNRYLNLGQHSKMIECHLRIIEDMKKCEKDKCTYKEIGIIYMTTNNYVKAAKFLELSLEHESNNLVQTSTILINLSSIYKLTKTWPWPSEKEEKIISQLITTCKEMTDETILNNWKMIITVITVLNEASYSGNFLEERLFLVMSNSSTKIQLEPKDAVELLSAVKKHKSNNDTKIVLLGSILLTPFENYNNLSAEGLLNVLEITMDVSFARLNLWEISKFLDGLEHVFITIQESEVLKNRPETIDIKETICFSLIIRWNYIYPCYMPTMPSFEKLLAIQFKTVLTLQIFGYLVVVIKFDFYTETKPHPMQKESMQTQQKSKALTTPNYLEFEVQTVKDLIVSTITYSTPKIIWYDNISPHIWLYIKLNNLVRFSLNVLFVWFKLWIFFSILAGLTGVYFNVFVYILENILAPRYLAIIHNPASFQLTRYSVIVTCDVLILSIKIQARLLQNFFGFLWMVRIIRTFRMNKARLHSLGYYRDYDLDKVDYVKNKKSEENPASTTCITLFFTIIKDQLHSLDYYRDYDLDKVDYVKNKKREENVCSTIILFFSFLYVKWLLFSLFSILVHNLVEVIFNYVYNV